VQVKQFSLRTSVLDRVSGHQYNGYKIARGTCGEDLIGLPVVRLLVYEKGHREPCFL